jgi:hypothetical protein
MQRPDQQQLLPPATEDLMYATSLQAAMEVLESEKISPTIDTVFILGGEAVRVTHACAESWQCMPCTA